METWQKIRYQEAGIIVEFVQDNHSRSEKGVIRGLHYQLKHAQDKLVYVMRGAILDVVVDLRQDSETFGQWTASVLSDENHKQLFVPRGFAHGFSVLSGVADVVYKCSDYYTPGDEYGILYNDPDLAIDWQVSLDTALISEKDLVHPYLKDVPDQLLFGN